MTPDTPRFSIPPLDVAVAAIRSNEAIADSVDDTWTDDQDKLLQSVRKISDVGLTSDNE